MWRRFLATLFALGMAFGQPPAFEVASVKPSQAIVGHDGAVTVEPGRFRVRNATLKRLIFEAYRVPYSQISGGPPWLDSQEYDIDAKAASPVNSEQIKLMLRTLLTDRFELAIRTESKERRVYVLTVSKDGPRLQGTAGAEGHKWRFHGDLTEFAGVLALQLTIPFLDDPTTPSHARGDPIPVLNKTGVEGVYDINLDIKPDSGADPFTVWQRALQEQLGLKLESQKAQVETLIVDHVEKMPTEN
jgi:uncharacterized protein (TIGR03435 family)